LRAEDELAGALLLGENLLWTGRPPQGFLFRRADALLIPFSLVWGGFAIFWEAGVIAAARNTEDGSGTFFPVFGIPFVLIGLYLIFGRFIFDSIRRAQMTYGLTTQRVLISESFPARRTQSLFLNALPMLDLTEYQDGSGTITFSQPPRGYGRMSWNGPGVGLCFERIPNAKSVFAQISDARGKALK
jgi:hypothetical protein